MRDYTGVKRAKHRENFRGEKNPRWNNKSHGPCYDCGSVTTYMSRRNGSSVYRPVWCAVDGMSDTYRCKKCDDKLYRVTNKTRLNTYDRERYQANKTQIVAHRRELRRIKKENRIKELSQQEGQKTLAVFAS
jgi:hypothetical protein